MGDLEHRTEPIQISTAGIPIIKDEAPPLVIQDDVEATNRIFYNDAARARALAPDKRVISAFEDDLPFSLYIHLGLVSYALRQTEQIDADRQIAEVRNEVLEASVEREWWQKCKLYNQLKNQEDAHQDELLKEFSKRADVVAKYIYLIYLFGITNDQHETQVQELEKEHELAMQFFGLRASDEIEARETIIKMYEERFGLQEELMRLSKAEENSKLPGMLGPRKYADISALTRQHETGKQPKTIGQKMVYCFEKLLNPDTYGNIARAVYRVFRKDEKK